MNIIFSVFKQACTGTIAAYAERSAEKRVEYVRQELENILVYVEIVLSGSVR